MEKTTKQKLLFIGDSITDVGRNRNNPGSLGKGYVAMIAKALADRGDAEHYQLINRGISGNRIHDIAERWHGDCVSLEPDVVTMLIGINDTWHNVGDETVFATKQGAEQFEMHYRHLLASLRKKSNARIILMEPFVFPYPEDRKTWRVDLDPKQEIVKRLAEEFDADWIGLDAYLNTIGAVEGYETLSNDGVHPTQKGHRLIADAWLEKFDDRGKE
jgi:lysophospholipase L1-like esterase